MEKKARLVVTCEVYYLWQRERERERESESERERERETETERMNQGGLDSLISRNQGFRICV